MESGRKKLFTAFATFALIGSCLGYVAGSFSLVERTWKKGVQLTIEPDVSFPDDDSGLLAAAASQPAVATPVIFDTDIGNDVDDVLALALLHELADRGEAELLAVTISKDNRWCAPHVDLINTFYGRPDVPIGVVRNGETPEDGKFNRQVVEKQQHGRPAHPHSLRASDEAPEAVALLRQVLAAQPDDSVVFVTVGFLTNAARLLASTPDASSPLPGLELVRKKVRLYVPMLGAFDAQREPEYNAINDSDATRAVLSGWPTPLVATGFEVGQAVRYPGASILRDFRYAEHHPVVDAYFGFMTMPYDRPTWDLTAVLHAVRPDHGYFGVSAPGHISLDEDGVTRFAEDPSGRHRYLVLAPAAIPRLREIFVQMVSSPPGR